MSFTRSNEHKLFKQQAKSSLSEYEKKGEIQRIHVTERSAESFPKQCPVTIFYKDGKEEKGTLTEDKNGIEKHWQYLDADSKKLCSELDPNPRSCWSSLCIVS